MRDVTTSNFGIAIAYLIPGLVALYGVSLYSDNVAGWLRTAPPDSPTIGGFLYVTLGSLSAGMIVSAVRWAIIDTIHHRTGIPVPDRDFSRLQERLEAYQYLVSTHYIFYQHYSNMLTAIVLMSVAWIASGRPFELRMLLLVLAIIVMLWFGARDALRHYYLQGHQLLANEAGLSSQSYCETCCDENANCDAPDREIDSEPLSNQAVDSESGDQPAPAG